MARYSPQIAWDELANLKTNYYRKWAAEYNGDKYALNSTAEAGSFWNRRGNCKVHVPIAADIASTSADLLFGQEVRFNTFHQPEDEQETPQQKRLDVLVHKNHLSSILNEAAESAAALGDVYLKLNWRNNIDYPVLTVVHADSAIPEYTLGILDCIHFFNVLRADFTSNEVWRVYECYERGKITMSVFKGDTETLGSEQSEETLNELGFEHDIIAPVNDILAVHIPNVKPNRMNLYSMMGRSDFDGLRGLMDALDETYSSWMRDIRLAKARLIVPSEYLRKRPDFDSGNSNGYTYEFDEDVETLVALDIDPDHPGTGITPSQFEIRSTQHAQTCADIIRQIVMIAGYSPQTFGFDITGMAQSGTALNVRQKKSYNTLGKKQTYWQDPLEVIVTSMVHIDAVINPNSGSHADDEVKVTFADNTASDLSTMATALDLVNRATSASTEVKVKMLHPDWNAKQIDDEVSKIKQENGLDIDNPDMGLGDYELQKKEEQ